MNKFYKRFLLLVFLVLGISGTVIYTTVDIHTLRNITEFHSWSLALAVLAVSLGMFFDGSRLMHLVRISNERITLYQAVQVIFGNYFLALLTPGATGGAVAQLMFLRHAGVPTGKAAVLVIVRTLSSIFFLVLCMPFIFLHDAGIVPGISNETLMAVTLAAFAVILGIVFGARKGTLDYAVIRLTKRCSNEKRKKIFAFYRDTKSAIQLLLRSPRSMLLVFVESGLNLLCIYAIVPCLLLGMGVTDADWYTVMGRMIFLNMLLYFMPTPGGSGVAEGGFVLLFADTVPAGTVGIVAVCWRLIAEYIPFFIGFYYTIAVFGKDFLNRHLAK
ncbi:MAG: flippase-like domain-containing protein [Selenomonadaceae bacterium]|nr:flippase-like domain-containing protein [Selenomonadaceae bacterium]